MAEPLERLCGLSKPDNKARETGTTEGERPNPFKKRKLFVNRPTPFPCCQKLFLNQICPVQEEHKVKFNRFSLWNSFPSHKKQGE